LKLKNVASQIKIFVENLLRFILIKSKRAITQITRFLHSSRKTILLVVVTILTTLICSFLIAAWLSGNNYEPKAEYDRIVPTTGEITVQGLEIYGGDIKYTESETLYVDWGELTLGSSSNSSFNIKSTSNIDVELQLNVTNWTPLGIEKYIEISWDYNGTLLSPNTALWVSISLEVASGGDFIDFLVENEVTAFGFDMIIYASEV